MLEMKEVKDFIVRINKQPKSTLFELFKEESIPGKKDYTTICNKLIENAAEIRKAFELAYLEGENVENFQIKINECFTRAGVRDNPLKSMLLDYTSNWMDRIEDAHKIKPNEIILPGTHDSGAYRMSGHTPIIADSFWKKALSFVTNLPIIRGFVKNWVVTQDKSIKEQLDAGIRLFDFRLGKNKGGELFLSHGKLNCRLERAINDVAEFMQAHPSEIISINLKDDHAYKDHLNKGDRDGALALFKQKLESLLVPKSSKISDMKTMRANNQRVLLYASREFGVTDYARNDSKEYWPEEADPDKVSGKVIHMLSNPVVKREMNYVSFNSTPDFNAVKTGLLRFSSLKSNSIKLQERLDELLDHEVSKKVSGIILDSPQPRSIQKILVKNHKTFEQKLVEEKANQNTATNITRN